MIPLTINKDTVSEVQKVIEQANRGNWIPMAIVAGCVAAVFVLIVYIWNQKNKVSDEKHSTAAVWMEKLTESTNATEKLIAQHDTRLDNHDRELMTLNNKKR
jgi:hypothetical protein